MHWLTRVRGLFAIVACCLAPLAARGQSNQSILVITTSSATDTLVVPDGTVLVPAGKMTTNQLAIPRYRAGTTYPSGQIIGWGPQSVVAASSATQSQAVKAIIYTEGLTDAAPGIAEWQVGSTGYSAAVLQPRVSNITVTGYTTDEWASAGSVNDQPWVHNIGSPELYKGLYLYAGGGAVDNLAIMGIPGVALDVGRPISPRNGFAKTFDRLKWNIRDLSVRRVFAGVYEHAVDSHLTNVEVEAFRDYGIKLFASVHFQNLHTYGGGYAAGPGGGPGIWLESNNNHGGPIYPENSPIGLRVDGQYSNVTGIYAHTCATACCAVYGQSTTLSGVYLSSSPIGVLLAADQCNVSDGRIIMQDSGRGIHITAGSDQFIRGLQITGYQPALHGHPEDTFGDNAVGIDVDDVLERSSIDVVVSYCTKGIDFSGGTIANDGSRVWVRTTNVTTPVTWPAGQTWSTTPNANDKRDIRINGERYYQQGI